MKILFLIFMFFNFLYAKEGMKNIDLNTMDASEVQEKVHERVESVNFKNMEVNTDYKKHIANVENLQSNIKNIIVLQKELRVLNNELQSNTEKYNQAEEKYTTKMNKIYLKNDNIQRVTYYLLSHDLENDYQGELKNFIVDKYAIEKYDQNTEIKESSAGIVSYENVITTNKYFGQMQIDTLKDITFRDKGLNVKLIKVVQYPFVKSSENKFVKSFSNDVDKFDESVNVSLIEMDDIQKIESFLKELPFSSEDNTLILSNVNEKINIEKSKVNFDKASLKIKQALKKIAKEHEKYVESLNKLSEKINDETFKVANKKDELDTKMQDAQKIADIYKVTLNFDELEKLIIVTPKLYSEYVELGEEKEFILRKIKSYLSKVSISELQQSETLTNYYDLQTKNLQKQKLVEYESIHFFPFVKGKELAILVFGLIELEDKVSKKDYVVKELQYSTIEFIPVKKGFETIFVASSEITLGTVKEFLQTHRVNKYFDRYCIEDSLLPDGAKDFQNINEEFYNYPAVCFKMQRVSEFMEWLAEKTQKNVKFANSDEWSYVASNANSSEYCWGNESLDELNEDGLKPANIYYEDGEDTSIQKVKQFDVSMLGTYDMCGNVHELVKDGDDFMIKGNSYISFIESSSAPALEYDDNLNVMIGIRAFYITEN